MYYLINLSCYYDILIFLFIYLLFWGVLIIKLFNFRSRSLTGDGCLLEVTTVRLLLGGGRLREVRISLLPGRWGHLGLIFINFVKA